MKAVAVVMLVLASWCSGVGSVTASALSQDGRPLFRVYLPTWLPAGFRQIVDPDIRRYPDSAAHFFMRRFGTHDQWVNFFEGPAGCCLDSPSSPVYHFGPTRLSKARTAYFSDQGVRFGGLFLYWDQDHTYIVISSPQLSKKILVHIADAVTRSRIVHP